METLLTIIGAILAFAIFIFFFAFAVIGLQYIVWFHWRTCKYCSHNMEYKGLKEDGDNSHYLFHCPHCGAWEQIPKEEFFRDLDKFNPNDSVS